MTSSTSFKQYFEAVLAGRLKKGDKIKNTNPDCEHAGSEGEVKDIVDLPLKGSKQVKSKHNMPGKLVKYKVTNTDGKNYEEDDTLYKDPSQLTKKK